MEGYKNMDTNTINILVGYLIGINLVSLIAVYIKGKTNRKIALELDITIEAVKKRKKRILIRLQNEYKR